MATREAPATAREPGDAGPKLPRGRGARRASARVGAWRPRWFWPAFAAPGMVWLVVLFLLPFYVVLSIAFGAVDPLFRTPVPVWNPVQWNPFQFQLLYDRIFGARRLPRPGVRADLPVRGRGQRALPAAGLPGRLLRDPLRRPPQGAAAGGAAGPVLDQLHDAHAGLGEPAGERGHGQPPAGRRRAAGRAVPLAGRPAGHRHPGAGLRLHPLHGAGPVRRAGPGRPAAAGGGPGPGGEPAPDLRAWSPCPCPARPSWPGWS